MKTEIIDVGGRRTIVAAMAKGDEAVARLSELVRTHAVHGASITAVGAFRRAVVGYFDRDRRDYERIPIEEQVEVLSLIGDVAMDGEHPVVHVHVVLGRHDGTTRGGHLLEAEVWPTLEVVVEEVPAELRKTHDPETGLALLDLGQR